MRPVRLQMQGFTCYREKQEIDFTRLGLFAIAGPTGAGKSSILDAMAFALYGKIPRMGVQNLDEFISLGAARAAVLFEFEAQGGTYRVVRSMPRSGARKVQLESIAGGVAKAVADGVGEVNAHLQRLLGLEYDAFIQSVLLPQGEFSKFLKSKPSEQQQILRELLRLGIYERMRARAHSEAKEIAGRMKTDAELLEGPYAGATPAKVSELENEFASLRARKEAAGQQVAGVRESLARVRALWALVQEREDRERRLRRLGEDRARIEEVRQTAARARLAARIAPALDRAAAALEARDRAAAQLRDIERSLTEADAALSGLASRLAQAQASLDTVPAKRERAMALAAIEPVIKERAALTARLRSLRAQLPRPERAEGELAEAQARLQRLERQRAELRYDSAAHTIFKNAGKLAHQLTEANGQAARLKPAVVQAESSLADAEAGWSEAERGSAEAEAEAWAAQSALETLQNLHKAASLRATLTPGCTCPVCEQPVAAVPPPKPPEDLERAQTTAAKAKEKSQEARRQASLAHARFSRAQADLENARAAADQWERKAADLTRSLAAAILPRSWPAGAVPDRFVHDELARADRLQAQWTELGDGINQARLEILEAGARVGIAGQIADAEKKLADYGRRIGAVSSGDPEKELAAVQEEIAAIERTHRQAVEEHGRAAAEAHRIELEAAGAKARWSSAEQERESCRAAADQALSEAGFADPAEARNAARAPAALAAAEQEIESYGRDVRDAQTRIAELDSSLAGVHVTEADVHRETEAAADAEAALGELTRQEGALAQKLSDLKQRTERAEELRREHEQRRARHRVVYQLAQDLRADCFQQYLLNGIFRNLVAGASLRLRELNARYELALDGDSRFTVVDHDHGGLTRFADTLSGGETFLVSLALALELSEQVQKAAGAVRLDSLFIDEGFGTLDPETLETVAGAIESLGRTNRMVGVITHVPELHRRLPRLEVRPSPSGSTVQYVED